MFSMIENSFLNLFTHFDKDAQIPWTFRPLETQPVMEAASFWLRRRIVGNHTLHLVARYLSV